MVRHTCVYCDLTSSFASLESTDLRGTVQTLVDYAVRLLGTDAADVLVYDAAGKRLVNAGGRGVRGKGIENTILRLEDTPVVWVPPEPVRQLRVLISHRHRLIRQRT